jgi:molecular chaperone HtpG
LLFIPKRPPFDLFQREYRSGVRLYVKRVFVMEECDALLPEYLRFVRGIVDSDDLPLNVSREILQADRLVESIKKQVTKKTIDMLIDMADEKPDDYKVFWEGYGKVLKEGVHTDHANREKLAKLLRFESSEAEEMTSLTDYVSRMKDGQEAIYFISGPDKAFLSKSPHIEGLKAKGFEVLFFTDAVDEWIGMGLPDFDGKKLVSATKGELKLDEEDEKNDDEAKDGEDSEKTDDAKDEDDALVTAITENLSEKIGKVRYTERLTTSPVCLVSGQFDPGANLERILKAHGQGGGVPGGKRTLELNAKHPLIANLKALAEKEANADQLKGWTALLYDQALLTEGSTIDDPAAFAAAMNELLLTVSGQALAGE